MATYEEHIEGLTKIDITSTSIPNQTQLTGFLVDGLIDCVNKMITLKPEELSKFTKTTNATDSVAKKGRVLSVLREHDSASILRICTPINPSLRYEATDVDSLYYRSKYNPGYYERDGLIICVPEASGSGNNDIVVTQVHYDTGLINSDEYNGGVVENFPLEYEYLIALYAAAMSCNSIANDIHNNMPTEPAVPISPDFTNEGSDLPDLPLITPPILNLKSTLSGIESAIGREDFDMAEKQVSLFDKKVEEYSKDFERENSFYQKELEIFKSDLERVLKNSDRKLQIEGDEYKAELERYAGEIQFFQADLQEKITQYKWYTSQYISFINQYNLAFGLKPKQQKPKEGRKQDSNRKGNR
jgi:hypothetical protein